MFSKILIANRGEIAVRIIRACKEMGISTVAVYSEADADALHVSLADESFCIGPAAAAKSYLNGRAVVTAALLSGSEAIHPGYGLLSEDAAFAELCVENGIEFIGPSPATIRVMGDKNEARAAMRKADVPVIPGSPIVETAGEALEHARKIGYPLLLKARSGGGGKGIRRIDSDDELSRNFALVSAEAKNNFGDGVLYMEKFLFPVKHIEMQLIADAHGAVVCLGERECSVQRKNQKMIEESPSVQISDKTRQKMTAICQKAAKACKYLGLGTIEFLLDKDGNFYFMEMNTRLQVEHPVTEFVTGVDLVKWQIRVAAGLPLGFSQKDARLSGHSIECRVNAEDPENGFRPSCGKISFLHIPGAPGVRFDSAMYCGYSVPPFYDSMVGKLIVHAENRESALRKMNAALCELAIEGITTNVHCQLALLNEKAFVDGSYTTDFVENALKKDKTKKGD
ncbi:MAG: acetyl-CoA carboxylase biotin carboxylase subunit [Clostridiales bacterium]|jgi:acetyl-CoA carboxylase biotin carboxylase subunit|nr:acetyl-CoA carboxylase biotin carboxylase subunit [Clostridiales bacterium]